MMNTTSVVKSQGKTSSLWPATSAWRQWRALMWIVWPVCLPSPHRWRPVSVWQWVREHNHHINWHMHTCTQRHRESRLLILFILSYFSSLSLHFCVFFFFNLSLFVCFILFSTFFSVLFSFGKPVNHHWALSLKRRERGAATSTPPEFASEPLKWSWGCKPLWGFKIQIRLYYVS